MDDPRTLYTNYCKPDDAPLSWTDVFWAAKLVSKPRFQSKTYKSLMAHNTGEAEWEVSLGYMANKSLSQGWRESSVVKNICSS